MRLNKFERAMMYLVGLCGLLLFIKGILAGWIFHVVISGIIIVCVSTILFFDWLKK